VTAAEHLGQALRLLEAEASEIEHRMAFVRAAIEAFGLDADSLLMDVIAEEERADVEYWQDAKLRADAAGIPPVEYVAPTNWVRIDVPEAVVLPTSFVSSYDAPETAQQDGPEPPYGRTPEGRWDWNVVAQEIGNADTQGQRRAVRLKRLFDVPFTTAQWMVKRCREQGLIDIDRPTFTERNARDRAAAAL
jgi:hypothetical protein